MAEEPRGGMDRWLASSPEERWRLFRENPFGILGDYPEQREDYETKVDTQIEDVLGLAEERVGEAGRIHRREWDEQLAAYDLEAGRSYRALEGGLSEQRDIYEALPGQIEADRLGFLGQFNQFEEAIQRGYGDRYRFAEEELEGYGEAARADIGRAFDEERALTMMDLQRRGVLSSTQAATEFGGVAEMRAGELRRLDADVADRRMDVLGGIDAERLTSQRQMGMVESAYDAAMRGDVTAANQMLGQFYGGAGAMLSDWRAGHAANRSNIFGAKTADQTNIYLDTTGDWLNAQAGINYIPPTPPLTAQQMGAGFVQPASAPSSEAGWQSGATEAAVAALMMIGPPMVGLPPMPMPMSDRNMKRDIRPLDEDAVLDRVAELPVSRWRYKDEIDPTGTEHVGPMAQDFQAAFDLGDGRTINLLDAVGTLFAAVKALARERKVA